MMSVMIDDVMIKIEVPIPIMNISGLGNDVNRMSRRWRRKMKKRRDGVNDSENTKNTSVHIHKS